MLSLVIAALVCAAFAAPALAKAGYASLQATLSGDGDPDGSGFARLTIDTKTSFGTICHDIDVADVSLPVTGGAITIGTSGEIVGRLIIQDRGSVLKGCTAQLGIKSRDLKRIQTDPGSHFVHLYNDEHPCDVSGPDRVCPPGAVVGRLARAR